MRFAPKIIFSKFLFFLNLFSGHLEEQVTVSNVSNSFPCCASALRNNKNVNDNFSFLIWAPCLTLSMPRVFKKFTLFLLGIFLLYQISIALVQNKAKHSQTLESIINFISHGDMIQSKKIKSSVFQK